MHTYPQICLSIPCKLFMHTYPQICLSIPCKLFIHTYPQICLSIPWKLFMHTYPQICLCIHTPRFGNAHIPPYLFMHIPRFVYAYILSDLFMFSTWPSTPHLFIQTYPRFVYAYIPPDLFIPTLAVSSLCIHTLWFVSSTRSMGHTCTQRNAGCDEWSVAALFCWPHPPLPTINTQTIQTNHGHPQHYLISFFSNNGTTNIQFYFLSRRLFFIHCLLLNGDFLTNYAPPLNNQLVIQTVAMVTKSIYLWQDDSCYGNNIAHIITTGHKCYVVQISGKKTITDINSVLKEKHHILLQFIWSHSRFRYINTQYTGQGTIWIHNVLDREPFEYTMYWMGNHLNTQCTGWGTIWIHNVLDREPFEYTMYWIGNHLNTQCFR